jgi:predicted  nucleic acid-binding Zn-ribbon protein
MSFWEEDDNYVYKLNELECRSLDGLRGKDVDEIKEQVRLLNMEMSDFNMEMSDFNDSDSKYDEEKLEKYRELKKRRVSLIAASGRVRDRKEQQAYDAEYRYDNRIHFEIKNELQELNEKMEKLIMLLQQNSVSVYKIGKRTKKNRRVKTK